VSESIDVDDLLSAVESPMFCGTTWTTKLAKALRAEIAAHQKTRAKIEAAHDLSVMLGDQAKAAHIQLLAERAEREDLMGKLTIAMEGLECAALHARSAVKSWESGKEHTVTHARDAENAALVCEGVLAKIRGAKQ